MKYVSMAVPPGRRVRSRWYGPDVEEARPTIQILEDDREPQDTGLLDASGTRIYRVPGRATIGFLGSRDS